MRIRGADKPRRSASRVDFERFDRAISATEGMHAIRPRGVGPTGLFTRARGQETGLDRPCDRFPSSQVAVSILVNHLCGEAAPVGGVCNTGPHARDAVARASRPQGTARPHQGPRALIRDRVLRVLVTDLVAARTAAGMTQQAVAMRMWTTKSAVSRLESGRYARLTLDTVEKYALVVSARVEICVRPGW